MTQSIFILWETQEQTLDHWRYAGDGENVPVFKDSLKTHRCRYSSRVSNKMLASANHYAKHEATSLERFNVRVEIQND